MKNINLILALLLFGLLGCNDKRVVIKNRVIDSADILTKQQEDSIFSLIYNLDTAIGPQIAVLTIKTLNGEGINEFSIKQAEKLNLGRDQFKDGVLLTVVPNEKILRIEVGFGLERILPDELTAKIIRDVIIPRFRKQRYGEGIYYGVDSLKRLIEAKKEFIGRHQ